jgi:hypothetical protein
MEETRNACRILMGNSLEKLRKDENITSDDGLFK